MDLINQPVGTLVEPLVACEMAGSAAIGFSYLLRIKWMGDAEAALSEMEFPMIWEVLYNDMHVVR